MTQFGKNHFGDRHEHLPTGRMVHRLILLLSILLVACTSKEELSSTQKLQLTAKVWGFLKYYHPRVNEGKLNWDQQLVTILSKLNDVRTEQDLSDFYLTWIDTLGEVRPCSTCSPKKGAEYFDKNFDLSWLQRDVFSPALVEKLRFIEQHRTQAQHYIHLDGATTYFDHEPNYKASQWNEEKIRLITLFRYWNVIEYFYPYKYVMDQDWDEVLVEMIPRFQAIQSEEAYHVLLHELTVKLCDSHAFFVTDPVSLCGQKVYRGTVQDLG